MPVDNPLLSMLKPWTLAAVALGPFVFQYLKALIMRFNPRGSEIPKTWSAILHVATVVGVIVWQGVAANASVVEIAAQCAIGIIVAELIYKQAVEPMANSSSPIVPQTATDKHAKEEKGQ